MLSIFAYRKCKSVVLHWIYASIRTATLYPFVSSVVFTPEIMQTVRFLDVFLKLLKPVGRSNARNFWLLNRKANTEILPFLI